MASSIEGNKTIRKLLGVLDLFIRAGSNLSIARLCYVSGMPRASLYRLLNPMVEQGFLHLDQGAKIYSPGPKLYHLGLLAQSSQDWSKILPPILEKIHQEIHNTVVVTQSLGGHVVHILKREKPEGLKVSPILGVPRPVAHGILGKLILAYRPEEEARALLEAEPPQVWLTGAYPGWDEARALFRQIKKQGYYSGLSENDPGTFVVGVALHTMNGTVNTAMGILIPTPVCTDENVQRCLDLLHAGAREIAKLTGYRPTEQKPDIDV
jgi:DNA-binding IclR family transcriptional regulator